MTPDEIRRATHFLENATFGPTAADITAVLLTGRDNWIEQQFTLPESQMPDGLDTNQTRAQLFLNMANGADQLRQRVMFALSQTIVVSANKTSTGPELIPWIRLLSRNASGNYRTLLIDVTVSPTMGKYLDLAYSRKASATSAPNENYPRELMQLFTIGLWELNMDGTRKLDGQGQPIPTYTQQTTHRSPSACSSKPWCGYAAGGAIGLRSGNVDGRRRPPLPGGRLPAGTGRPQRGGTGELRPHLRALRVGGSWRSSTSATGPGPWGNRYSHRRFHEAMLALGVVRPDRHGGGRGAEGRHPGVVEPLQGRVRLGLISASSRREQYPNRDRGSQYCCAVTTQSDHTVEPAQLQPVLDREP